MNNSNNKKNLKFVIIKINIMNIYMLTLPSDWLLAVDFLSLKQAWCILNLIVEGLSYLLSSRASCCWIESFSCKACVVAYLFRAPSGYWACKLMAQQILLANSSKCISITIVAIDWCFCGHSLVHFCHRLYRFSDWNDPPRTPRVSLSKLV